VVIIGDTENAIISTAIFLITLIIAVFLPPFSTEFLFCALICGISLGFAIYFVLKPR